MKEVEDEDILFSTLKKRFKTLSIPCTIGDSKFKNTMTVLGAYINVTDT